MANQRRQANENPSLVELNRKDDYDNMETTVKQIAERFKVDTLAAQKLLDFLRAAGAAQTNGTVPKAEGQKGKAPNVWKLWANKLTLNFDTGVINGNLPPVDSALDKLMTETNELLAA